MGPAWIWFVIAVIAALAGVALLAADRQRESSRQRERARWADGHHWRYAAADPRLISHWTEGAMAYYGADAAVNVASGTVAGDEGPRTVYVFDLSSGRQTPATVVAVRCGLSFPVLLEMWLDSVPIQRSEMPDLLGPVGKRYAFADDVEVARELLSRELVDAAGELGGDVSVVWLERDWVLAAVSTNAGPSRLDRLVRGVVAVADAVDPDDGPTGRHASRPPSGARPRVQNRATVPQGVRQHGHPPPTP